MKPWPLPGCALTISQSRVRRVPSAIGFLNNGNQLLAGNNFVIDTLVMLRLQAMRQESLRKLAEKMAQARVLDPPNGGSTDGTGPAPSVPPAT